MDPVHWLRYFRHLYLQMLRHRLDSLAVASAIAKFKRTVGKVVELMLTQQIELGEDGSKAGAYRQYCLRSGGWY
jgi:hypothetical protein